MAVTNVLSLRERALEAAHAQRVAQETTDREREERHSREARGAFEASLRALLGGAYNPQALAEMPDGRGGAWFRYTDLTSDVTFAPWRSYSLAVFLQCARCRNGLIREFGFGAGWSYDYALQQADRWLPELGCILELAAEGQIQHQRDEECPARDVENALRDEQLRSANATARINEQAQDRTAAEDLVQALRAALGLES